MCFRAWHIYFEGNVSRRTDATDKQDSISKTLYSWTSFNACRSRDFYNYHMSKSATKQQPLFHLTPENPESQMPQMLLTDVSIWKRKAAQPQTANYYKEGEILSQCVKGPFFGSKLQILWKLEKWIIFISVSKLIIFNAIHLNFCA